MNYNTETNQNLETFLTKKRKDLTLRESIDQRIITGSLNNIHTDYPELTGYIK